LWALAAASGARIGELQALRIGPSDASSSWNSADATLTIKTSVWRGKEQAPKTEAGLRTIEIAAPVNDRLKGFVASRTDGFIFGNGRPADVSTLRARLDKALPSKGFHSFRRYRTTVLRGTRRCPEEIIQYWLGHSNGGSITNRYSKVSEDTALRRRLADEIGIGFKLP
jgi:integrase